MGDGLYSDDFLLPVRLVARMAALGATFDPSSPDPLREAAARLAAGSDEDADPRRSVEAMGPADVGLLCSFVDSDLRGGLLLVHYDPMAPLRARATLPEGTDLWALYGGALRQCRSIVVDLGRLGGEGSAAVASLPYPKFFNLGERAGWEEADVQAAMAGAAQLAVTEKLDGSFCQVRYRPGRGLPDDLLVTSARSFASDHVRLFRKAIARQPGVATLARAQAGCTLILEYVDSRTDPHTVLYADAASGLYLLDVRDVGSGAYRPPEEADALAAEHGLPRPRAFAADLPQIMATCDSADPHEAEGFVVRADRFLAKVKTRDFAKLAARIESSGSFSSVIAAVAANAVDDLLPHMAGLRRERTLDLAARIARANEAVRSAAEAAAAKARREGERKAQVAVLGRELPSALMKYGIAALDGRLAEFCLVKGGGKSFVREEELKALERELGL